MLKTKQLKRDYTLLIPNMMNIHFNLIKSVFEYYGYKVELLEDSKETSVLTGLKYMHNDACYPAILCAGQFINALESDTYDNDKIALLMIQTGGGCRASNYIAMIKKAINTAGYNQVPIVSVNLAGLRNEDRLDLSLPMLKRAFTAMCYSDILMLIYNQARAHEKNKGESQKMLDLWIKTIDQILKSRFGHTKIVMKKNVRKMIEAFTSINLSIKEKVNVGIVGEIYVKYSSIANNNLEEFLINENCEIRVPGLLSFIQYAVDNKIYEIRKYGGNRIVKCGAHIILWYIGGFERLIIKELDQRSNFDSPSPYKKLKKMAEIIIGKGCKMGEGWMLTAEMLSLIEEGFPNIVCAQPFGCLPNHIVGKGMIKGIGGLHENANIVAIDYDSGSAAVNQENRIKLMLSNAKEATMLS